MASYQILRPVSAKMSSSISPTSLSSAPGQPHSSNSHSTNQYLYGYGSRNPLAKTPSLAASLRRRLLSLTCYVYGGRIYTLSALRKREEHKEEPDVFFAFSLARAGLQGHPHTAHGGFPQRPLRRNDGPDYDVPLSADPRIHWRLLHDLAERCTQQT